MNSVELETSRHFRTTGYLRVPGAVPLSTISELWGRAESLCRQSSGRLEDAYTTLSLRPEMLEGVLEAASRVIGPDIVLLVNRHNHLTVDDGGGLRAERAHRDSLGWTQTYLTCVVLLAGEGVESWTSVLPGSHLSPALGPRNGGGSWLDEGTGSALIDQLVPVPMRVGDAIFLDPLLFHSAGRGRPDNPRVAMSLALRAPDELALAPSDNELLLRGRARYEGQQWWATAKGGRRAHE
jgi:ectoine hydroxylase-related dioxygenase (phytanoyl-CoA dioxygenase family)